MSAYLLVYAVYSWSIQTHVRSINRLELLTLLSEIGHNLGDPLW